tara:strand:+ start:2033 stop:2470 length:438 start_codon:yes stop_codon:yes gene_type:complete
MFRSSTTSFKRDPKIVSLLYTELLTSDTVRDIKIAVSNRLKNNKDIPNHPVYPEESRIIDLLKQLITNRLKTRSEGIKNVTQFIYDECINILVCDIIAHFKMLNTRNSQNIWDAHNINRSIGYNMVSNSKNMSYKEDAKNLSFRF